MADAEVAVFALIELGPSGDQAKAPRPAHGQIVIGEVRAIAEMRIPAFARANVQHTISGVLNDISAIAEAQGKLGATGGRRRQHDVEKVVAVRAALPQGHPFILKIGECFAALIRHLIDIQQVRELQGQHAFAAGFGAKTHFRFAFKRIVDQDGSVNRVAQSVESNGGSGNVSRLVRGPYVVKGPVRVHFGLAEEQRLAAQRVQNHVERAGGKTVDRAVEIGLWSLRKGIEEHAKSLTRIQLGQERVPAGSKSGIWLRRNAGFTKLPEQVGGGGIRKA